MTLTNRLNLPSALVRAIQNDPYTRGDSDFSATGLLKPARMCELERRHAGELVEDAADRIWSLVGQIGHTILERCSDADLTEKRLFAEIAYPPDMTRPVRIVSGQLDVEHQRKILDWKFTCLAEECLCFTDHGWKRLGEINQGDLTLGYDNKKKGLIWTPIRKVHVFDGAPLLSSSNRSINVRCTPNHRWITESRKCWTNTWEEVGPVPVTDIRSHHRIRLAAPFVGEQQGLPITDLEASLIGWLVTDGGIQMGGKFKTSPGCSIYQSEKKFLKEVESVTAEYLSGRTRRRWGVHQFRLKTKLMRNLFDRVGFKSKEDMPGIVTRMSQSQRLAAYSAMVMAEGYIKDGKVITFAQKPGPVMEAFKILCVFLGIRLGGDIKHNKKNLCWVRPCSSPFINPNRPARDKEPGRQKLFQDKGDVGRVWCVSTDTGSFIAMSNGVAFLTGNSAWSVKDGAKEEWEQQTNIGRWLCSKNGIDVTEIEIVAILRDWSKLEARRDWKYPQFQVAVFKIPLWPLEQTEQFITERVHAMEMAKVELPECTAHERWAKPEKWAVMKKGRVRAIKLHDNEEKARIQAEDEKGYVEHRPGEDVRCEAYCRAAQFCEQFNKK